MMVPRRLFGTARARMCVCVFLSYCRRQSLLAEKLSKTFVEIVAAVHGERLRVRLQPRLASVSVRGRL